MKKYSCKTLFFVSLFTLLIGVAVGYFAYRYMTQSSESNPTSEQVCVELDSIKAINADYLNQIDQLKQEAEYLNVTIDEMMAQIDEKRETIKVLNNKLAGRN